MSVNEVENMIPSMWLLGVDDWPRKPRGPVGDLKSPFGSWGAGRGTQPVIFQHFKAVKLAVPVLIVDLILKISMRYDEDHSETMM